MAGTTSGARFLLVAAALAAPAGAALGAPEEVVETQLLLPGGEAYSVAFDGDWAMLGSPADEAVVVYRRDALGTWTEVQTLAVEPPAPRWFGWTVALEGGTALVGAINDTAGAWPAAGAVYVFGLDDGQWVQRQRLIPDVPAPQDQFLREDRFGFSVALDGATALIAAPWDETGATGCVGVPELPPPAFGSLYAFARDAGGPWHQQQKFYAATREDPCDDHTGWSLALQGARAIAGRRGPDSPGGDPETVVILARNEAGAWAESQIVTASGSAGPFGPALALDGATAILLAHGSAPAAYVLERGAGGTWAEAGWFELDADYGDYETELVDLEGDRVLVGGGSGALATVFARDPSGAWTPAFELRPAAAGFAPGRSVRLEGPGVLVGTQSGAYFFLLEEDLRVVPDESTGHVELRWLGGEPPWVVERAAAPQGPWTEITPPGGTADRGWIDDGALLDGETAFYRLRDPAGP